MAALGWKDRMYKKGLKALCDCGAIKRVGRGVYQINPTYAGKGEWKYNPKYERGGIEDLVATFNFKDKTIDTKIVWADDGKQSELNDMYREMTGSTPNKPVTIKSIVTKIPELDGVM